ncbi:hypothetical protein ABCS02_12925 [Microbacterium sp. X-17]
MTERAQPLTLVPTDGDGLCGPDGCVLPSAVSGIAHDLPTIPEEERSS